MSEGSILAESRNCWRLARAKRAAVIVDAADYFAVLADALAAAERQVLIAAWDLHSRLRLRREPGGGGGLPDELGPLLDALARRGVRIHVLDWDFAMLYAWERESFPLLKLGWNTHRRVEFEQDGVHPVGASHHQKVVVVDDALAFAGGIDPAASRWDTREHRPEEPRRVDPWGRAYPPFHDVQMAVDGEAAAALGELVRERWRRATGRGLRAPRAARDPWPASLRADFQDVRVAIARTRPPHDGEEPVREVKALFLDAIAAASRLLYVENQYLTSPDVGDALAARLREPDGPEIVIVLPRACSGWLEEATMGALRARLLRQLREADRHGRLRVVTPCAPDRKDLDVYVHAKVMVVDDRLLRVGSANLNNRSLGLDTECDLAVEASTQTERDAVARIRDGLLAEHLGAAPEEVGRCVRESGSLLAALDRFGGGPRALRPLDPEESAAASLEPVLPQAHLLDPERPVSFSELAGQMMPGDVSGSDGRAGLRVVAGLLVLLGLAAAWRWTPLGDALSLERLSAAAALLRDRAWGPPLAAVGIAVATVVMAPVTVLIVASAAALGPWLGFGTALAGALGGAAAGYGVGRVLWRDAVRRLAGERLNRLSRRLARRGVLAIATVRLVPIAPFGVVNVVAGATHIRFRDYLLGTTLAMAPGALGLALAADRAVAAARDPDWGTAALAAGLAALVVVGTFLARRWLEPGRGGAED